MRIVFCADFLNDTKIWSASSDPAAFNYKDYGQTVLSEIEKACVVDYSVLDRESDTEPINQSQNLLAFVNTLETLTAKQPSGASQLQQSGVDLLYWYKVQNLFHEYFTNKLDCPQLNSVQSRLIVVSALETIIDNAQCMAYFSLDDSIITFCNNLLAELRSSPEVNARANWQILSRLVIVFDTVVYKLTDRKESSRLIGEGSEKYDQKRKLTIQIFEAFMDQVVKVFRPATRVVLYLLGKTKSSGQEPINEIQKVRQLFHLDPKENKEQFWAFYSFLANVIAIQMNGGMRATENTKRQNFEENLPPEQIVQDIVKLFKTSDSSGLPCPADVFEALSKVMMRFTLLDIHPEFYAGFGSNAYCKAQCKFFGDYATKLGEFAETLTQENFNGSCLESDGDTMMIDTTKHKQINIKNSHLFSQKALNAFLWFIFLLVRIKTRPMQMQLFPLIVEPIIAILSLKPQNGTYLINLNNQKCALRILKEVTRTQALDDTSQFGKIIDRIKAEFDILFKDLEGEQVLLNHHTDDTVQNTNCLQKRQDFISSSLRFLCFVIVRADPNTAATNSAFVAHSRKILDSGIFEDKMREQIFKANKENPDARFKKVIDPILLYCIQLFTYVINDLPQKLQDYIRLPTQSNEEAEEVSLFVIDPNGMVLQIVKSLARRIPAQQDMFQILTQFLKMLSLNSFSQQMAYDPEHALIERFIGLALDPQYNKQLTALKNYDRMMEFRIMISSLAYENQTNSDRLLAACVNNINQIINQAWELTAEYAAIAKDDQASFDAFDRKHALLNTRLESVVALLHYYTIEELEMMDSLDYRSNVQTSLKNQDIRPLLMDLLRVPMIAKCPDNFQLYEVCAFVHAIHGPLAYTQYIQSIIATLKQQMQSLRTLLGVTDFDSTDLNPKLDRQVDLPDLYLASHDQFCDLLSRLSYEQKLWFTIARISWLISVLAQAEFLPRNCQQLGLYDVVNNQFRSSEMVGSDNSLRRQIHQLQSLLDRYHTIVFIHWQEEQLTKFLENKETIKSLMALEQINWELYKVDPDIRTIQVENRNMYYIYEFKTIDSLKWCQTVSKDDQNLLFDLAESKIKTTHECWKKSRQLLARLADIFKRRTKVVHIRNSQDPQTIAFNQEGADLTIAEVRAIVKMCHDTDFETLFKNQEKAMSKIVMIAGRVTWTLPDITELLMGKSMRNFGWYIIALLSGGPNGRIVDLLQELMLWSVRATKALDALAEPKYIFISQDIQDVFKTCLKVLVPLLQGSFMGMGNMQNFLVPFKSDLSQEILGSAMVIQEQSLCAQRLRNLLYDYLYLPVCNFFFVEHTELLEFCHDYQRELAEIVCSVVFGRMCGGFKLVLREFGLPDLIISPKNQAQDATKQETETQTDPVVIPASYEVEVLADMGFTHEQATKALQLSNNSFDAALELLLNKKVQLGDQQAEAQTADKLEEQQRVFEQNEDHHRMQIKGLMQIVVQSFGHIKDYFGSCSLTSQQLSVSNLFRFLKIERKQDKNGKEGFGRDVFDSISTLSKAILTKNVAVPSWLEVEFTIQMLQHLHKNSFSTLQQHLSMLSLQVNSNAEQLSIQTQIQPLKLLTAEEVPDKKELVIRNDRIKTQQQERKAANQQLLFNINEYLKLVMVITNYIQVYQESRFLDTLIRSEPAEMQDSFSDEQVAVIKQNKEDDEKKRNSLKEKWHAIVNMLKPYDDSNQIDTESIGLTLFTDEKEVGIILSQFFTSIEAVIKALGSIQQSFDADHHDGIVGCLYRSLSNLKILGDIQSLGAFDFRKQFVANDLLKSIFEVKIVDQWQTKEKLVLQDKNQMSIIRELLEGFWLQSKDLQRVYETLIKRQMFYQYKQTFKREENKELIDVLKTCILSEQITSPQLQHQSKRHEFDQNQSSQKKSRTKQKERSKPPEKHERQMRAVSEEKMSNSLIKTKSVGQNIGMTKQIKPLWPLTPEACSPKLIKKFIKKTEGYNKQKFNDFLGYFDSGAFGMNIKRVDLFMAAVAKVCMIKTEVETKDGQTTNETKIMLKRNVMRDLLVDPDFHSIVLPQPSLAQQNRIQFEQELSAWRQVSNFGNQEQSFLTRLQQDLVNQLLDCLMQQIRGYKMDLIKFFRDPTSGVKIDQDKYRFGETILNIKTATDGKQAGRQSIVIDQESTSFRKEYFFDVFAILNVFVSMLSLNLPIAEVILRHNDRKTIKFLFRNMFFLFSMTLNANRDVVLEPNIIGNVFYASKLTIMCNFLNHLMISNFGTRQTDIVVREEIQRILITQLAKQIGSVRDLMQNPPFLDWQKDARLVNCFGPIWLLTNFVMNKFTNEDENAKDVQSAILQKKFKHMRLQRMQMIKLLMLECQPKKVVQNQAQQFVLLEDLHRLSQQMLNGGLSFFSTSMPKFFHHCLLAVSNLVKLFDSSSSLFQMLKRRRQLKQTESMRSAIADESEALQIEQGSWVDEEGEMEFEEMEDEEEDEDLDDSQDENESGEAESSSPSDSYGSYQDDLHDGLSSHRSESPGSFDQHASFDDAIGGNEDQENGSEYDEDYGSSENSWERGWVELEDIGHEEERELIVTTKQNNNSPRNSRNLHEHSSYHDYDEEDSSSNFHVGNLDAIPSEEEEESDSSDDYGSQDMEQQEDADEMYNTFHSWSEHEVSREPVYMQDEGSFEPEESSSRSRSMFNRNPDRHEHHAHPQTYTVTRELVRAPNPFAEAPVDIQINMAPGIILGQNGASQIERLLESTIGVEVEMRQMDFYGEFGLNVSNTKLKIVDFRKLLRGNSAIYKQIMTHVFQFIQSEKPNLEEAKQPEPVSTFEQVAQGPVLRPRSQRKNALEIEGMDPLFMENLTSVGLQNIADSHQIHTRISNQARGTAPTNRGTDQTPVEILSNFITFLGSQTPQRRLELLNSIQSQLQEEMSPEMLQAARNLYQASGPDFTRLMNELRERHRAGTLHVSTSELTGLVNFQNTMQSPRRQLRPRILSMESATYDVRGIDDTAERVQDQQIQQMPSQQRASLTQTPKVVEIGGRNKIQLKGTQYMLNFYTMLNEQIVRFETNQDAQNLNQQCETLLNLHLIPSETDQPETIYAKLGSILDFSMMVLRNQREMEKDNPQFSDILISSFSIVDKIPYLRSCITLKVLSLINQEVKKLLNHRDMKALEPDRELAYKSDLQMYDSKTGRTRNVTMKELILFGLSCIVQMQEIANKSFVLRISKKREITKNLQTLPELFAIAKAIGSIDPQLSVLEGLMETMHSFLQAIGSDPTLLWGTNTDNQEESQKFYKELFALLLKILKSVQGAFKSSESNNIPVNSICKLFLGLLNADVNTQIISTVRKALAICIFDQKSSKLVSTNIKQIIDSLLRSTVEQLKLWSSPDKKVFNVTANIEKITQLLSIAGGLSKNNVESEICSDDMLLDVFMSANSILQNESIAEQIQPTVTQQVRKFMQRQDIRDLITLLFSLSEFSLKNFFKQKPQIIEEPKNQVGDEEMVSTFEICQQQADQKKEEELDDTEKLLQQHISRTSPHYSKFKAMVSFFLDNKKLLNQFIRVNHQLVNNELKNLVLCIPQILEFDTKRFIWRIELKKQHAKNKKRVIRITVNRERAFDDSFAHLNQLKTEDWKSQFDIQFVDEAGIDAGGLTKEWFMLLSKQMFDENLALFIKADNGSTYFPNPKSTVQGNFVELFTFVGKIIGKALWEQQLLDCYFIKAFYKMILDMPLDYNDLEDYDQSLYKSLKWILENNNVEQLSSYFVETMDYFGTQKEEELVPDGRNKLVTDDNKQEYVRLVANFRLDRAISEQKNAFLAGFYSIVPKDLLKIFDNRELELLISGLQNIDIDDLRENTTYNGYNARSRPVLLLWEVLQELENTERAEFIQFVTGSSKVPVEGFKGLRGPDGFQKFTIARIQTHGELRLPQSHTCLNTLDLPEYKDKETLKRCLLMAIREGKNFGIA